MPKGSLLRQRAAEKTNCTRSLTRSVLFTIASVSNLRLSLIGSFAAGTSARITQVVVVCRGHALVLDDIQAGLMAG